MFAISSSYIQIFIYDHVILYHVLLQKNDYTAEIKLLGVFLYFSFAVIISLTLFTLASRKATRQQQEFAKYFFCEATASDNCILKVDRLGDQTLTIVSFAMFSFAPYVTLIYIIRGEKIKAKWRSWRSKLTDNSETDA